MIPVPKFNLDTDPRPIYVILILVVAVPILSHAVLPVAVSPTTRQVYDFIENLAATKPNALVIVSFDYSTSLVPELYPQSIVIIQQLFELPLKIIFVAQWTDGPALTESVLDVIDKGSKKYGIDYAELGYIPNLATLIGMTQNLQHFFPIDTKGNPTATLPIIQQFPAGKLASLVVTFAGGEPGLDTYLQYWHTPFNTPIVVGATAISTPSYMPFLNSNQIVGLLISIRGAAEYEFLLNKVGLSGAGAEMVALSTSQWFIVIAIIFSNLAYFVGKTRGRRK